jgi:hypothetical protein
MDAGESDPRGFRHLHRRLGKAAEEMTTRSWELVATDESAVLPKALLDAVVVEESSSDGRLPDPPCADESDGCEVLGETNDLLDQLVASETGPRRWRG